MKYHCPPVAVLHGLFIVETEETLRAPPGFRLVLH